LAYVMNAQANTVWTVQTSARAAQRRQDGGGDRMRRFGR
jgi:hypothetical protein